MAINTGAGPHQAWLSVGGATIPIERGMVNQSAKRKSSTFSGTLAMSYPGARQIMAGLGDNEASIIVMTRGVTQTLVVGEIDETPFDYIGRAIEFTGRDKSAKLHENKSSEKWVNKKGSDIVSDLIGRVGLSGNVTASAIMAGKQLQQDFVRLSDNVSYAYVIHKLAQVDGMRWFVDNTGVFHYVPFNSPNGTYSIVIDQNSEPISADCLELKISRNVQAGKSIQSTVKSWHPKLKQNFSYTSNVEGNGGPKVYNYHVPGLVQDHVTKRAQSQASEKARNEFTVNATVVGDPSVSAGMGLSVSGTDFDQTFDIDRVSHQIGMAGHLTHITARGAKQGRSAQ